MNNKKTTIENQNFPQERALYSLKDTVLLNCTFSGAEDGESALKETRNIEVSKCVFFLRYPLWHTQGFIISDSSFEVKR